MVDRPLSRWVIGLSSGPHVWLAHRHIRGSRGSPRRSKAPPPWSACAQLRENPHVAYWEYGRPNIYGRVYGGFWRVTIGDELGGHAHRAFRKMISPQSHHLPFSGPFDCWYGGFAVESRCHTGRTCIYDVVNQSGWKMDIRSHRIGDVIEKILTKWEGVPDCFEEQQCDDCDMWEFEKLQRKSGCPA
ncbi:LOW QUALITY PROTEIN: hypothetical protein BC936DRAFT_141157 [Jimgerdemannia flammicorona]|uniref:Uncharacterized protein n=1 Tax=Jimgerdemannia flammicorona TaxID=994334 RepID=A0A433A2S8_9FUNG|nr:LOW QUALITY PROTEIN: hypothetical protein BC936DRAFT_141157 [Jimgerdemannia flammicorona]